MWHDLLAPPDLNLFAISKCCWLKPQEIALPYRSEADRVIYAVQLDEALWVVHAFQKKSTKGIKTPQKDIDLIKVRIKRLKEALR